MANWLGARSKEELIDSWRASSRQTDDGYRRWLLLIKELRVLHDASILEAERIALSKAHRRKWVEKQINTHQRCRKYALAHIRHNGDASLIDREGGHLQFQGLLTGKAGGARSVCNWGERRHRALRPERSYVGMNFASQAESIADTGG